MALNCYICRQQPSHLSVINPYSPPAAFLPFTNYCLKLENRAKGKTLKITMLKKQSDKKERKKQQRFVGSKINRIRLIKQAKYIYFQSYYSSIS